MDLRIVNTCNNDCLYCLEQGLRKKRKFIKKEEIFQILEENFDRELLCFYGGNPLLHPDLDEIIYFAKGIGYENISLLTNTFGVSLHKIISLKKVGLNNVGIYFNVFNEINHDTISGIKGKFIDLLNNISLYKKVFGNIKIIIHVNKLNVKSLYKDILILNKKFGIYKFDFVNYFPFDRPFENRKILQYDNDLYRNDIEKTFKLIKKLHLKVNFFKFSKDFFGSFQEFYSFEYGILKQFGDEDFERLNSGQEPFCFLEKRCKFCFLKDNCQFYGK